MSVTINAKGTSTPYFKIGKGGTTLFQGSIDPRTLYEPVDGDMWINNDTNSLSIKSANNWIAPVLGVTNPLIFPASSGDSGQVLSTDGQGNLTWISSSGSGTVTSASVVSANGFAGTVANSTTTPAITISTSVTGLVKGNGTAISAALAGTDYSTGTASLDTGILKTTTSTGNLTIAVASDFPTLNQNTTGTANNVTGIVSTDHGGTGLTSFVANRIFYAGDANTVSQSAGLTYNGANTLVIGSSGNATVFAGAGEALRLGSNSGNNIIVLGAAGDLSFASSVGTAGQVLTSQGANTSPTWTTITSGVSSFSGNSTGLTPNTATTGAIVLDGTLNISHGGTGAITANEAFNNLVPSQVTNNGKYLTTDGANTSWSTVTAGTLTGTTLNATVVNSSLTSVGTVTAGTWSGLFGAVSGANLTNITAANLSGTIPSATLGNSTLYIGTTAVTLNRASANQGLTGITSVAMPGATSGTITLTPAATAGTTAITIPATAGTLVTTGDTGTVTNAMLAGSIANANLANSSVTVNGTAISLGSSGTVTAAAGTLTGATLASGVTASSLTSIGTLSSLTVSGTTSLTGATTFVGSAATTPAAVAFSATAMTIPCASSNVFTTTFTANVTVAPAFSNLKDGQTINWFITQDATGSRTMTWPSSFKWPGGSAGVLSTAANSVDLLVATYRSATGFWYATLSKGFA